jgi:hypothetical protein
MRVQPAVRAALAASLLAAAGCGRVKLQKFQDARVLMGTKVEITVYCGDGQSAAEIGRASCRERVS